MKNLTHLRLIPQISPAILNCVYEIVVSLNTHCIYYQKGEIMHFPVGFPGLFDQVCEVIITSFKVIIHQENYLASYNWLVMEFPAASMKQSP